MVKSVYVPSAGGIIDFPDSATPEQMLAYINVNYGASEPEAPPAAAGPDQSGILGRFTYGVGTGLTDIPGGIASLFYPAEEAAKTSAGQFSEASRKYLQETFGIDPNKDPTTAQQAAEILGSVASFLIPGTGAAKAAGLLGKGAVLAGRVGAGVAAAQGAALGAEARSQRIQQQIASGMQITPEQQLAAQRLDAIVGLSEAIPVERFFGPIATLLEKVPVSKSGVVEKIIESRLAGMAKAGAAEGLQEAASNIANDLVEYGVYNPDVKIGDDVLSNAAGGAFAGSFVEGIIHLAAGRKLRPYRQLQSDLAKESGVNYEAARQGRIAQAAENLRQHNVNGPIDINEEDVDGDTAFTIRGGEENILATFKDRADAVEAVNRYAQDTAADVSVREPLALPEVFPTKVAGKSYNSMDEVYAARNTLNDTRNRLIETSNDADLIKSKADEKGVAPDFYRGLILNQIERHDTEIKKYDDFIDSAEGVKAAPPPEDTSETTPEEEAPEPITEYTDAVSEEDQPPVGVYEPPVEEQRYIEEAPVVDDNGAVDVPEVRTELRSSATAEQLSDLQTEMFGEPINIRQMTPEQRTAYEAERDSRYPPVPTPVYSASPTRGTMGFEAEAAPTPERGPGEPTTDVIEPKSMREAAMMGPRVRAYTPEVRARFAKIYNELASDLESIAPPETVLRLREFIDDAGPDTLVRGSYTHGDPKLATKNVIDLATGIWDPRLTIDQLIAKMREVLNHEVIHALRANGLIRASEWNMLSRAAVETKMPGKSYTYLDKAQAVYTPEMDPVYANPDAVIEEAVAEMYKDWVSNLNKPVKQTSPSRIWGLFNRITAFFKKIFNALKRNSYEDLFKSIKSGEVKARTPGQVDATGTRFSAGPTDAESDIAWTQERIDREIRANGYYDERSKGYVGWVNPRDFISATDEGKVSVRRNIEKDSEYYNEFNLIAENRQSPYLKVDDKFMRVTGHEGRHRMAALARRGITSVPIVITNYNGEVKKPISSLTLLPQGTAKKSVTVRDLIPLNEDYRSEIEDLMSRPTSGLRFSAAPALNSEDFKRWFKKSKVVDARGKPIIVYHHGSFTEDGNFVPRTPMHFGTIEAAKERAFGKKTDEAILSVTTYKNEDGLWHWSDGNGFTSEDAGEAGYISEKNALNAGRADVANREDYSDVEAEDIGTIVPVYLSIQNIKRVRDVGGSNGEWDAEIEKAKAEGYDGIVYKNLYEDKGSDSYIAFFPQQVKSPDSRFSPESVDIRFSAAPALNSDEFKRWFANSKAVNEDGSPKVYYHGTSKDVAFNSFKAGKRGIFFTDNPDSASQYAVENDSMGSKPGPGWTFTPVNTASRVIPVYLSYKNPYKITESDVERMNKAGNYQKSQSDLFQQIRAKDPSVDAIDFGGGVVVVFSPEQVKSIFNQFEPGTATSKKFSAAPALNSEEFRKWFRNSKIVDEDGNPLVVFHGTSDIFDEFKQDTGGKKDRGWLGRGFYFTNSTSLAKMYAMIKPGPKERVIPVYLSMQNPYYATLQEKEFLKAAEQSGNFSAAQEFTDKLVAAGHDGVILDYKTADKVKEYMILDAVQVKSVDNKFEPGTATSRKLSAAPLPPYIEQKNRTLFRPEPNVPFHKSMFEFFFGQTPSSRTLNTIYGNIDVSRRTRLAVSARAAMVDRDAAIEFLEKTANEKDTGNFERRTADYSAVAALAWARRSSQIAASVIMMGKPKINYARAGDIQSATISAEEDPDSLMNIFKILLKPGPVDSTTNKQKDNREIFKSYAVAIRSRNKAAAGKTTPGDADATYINTVIPFTQQNYPEVVQAYEMYQRYNKNLLTAAKDAGVISAQEFARLTREMDYYGFNREVYEEELFPNIPTKVGAQFKLREYRGSQYGNLIDDPMFVIVQNTQFWMNAIARNVATTKAFKLAQDMGEARMLGASEKPDLSRGESDQVLFFRESGVPRRFAVKDPLLLDALGSDDRADIGKAMKLMSLPTKVVRESVTRDPAFMIANLLRDTVSSWMTSGEDITPFLGTAKGFADSLKQGASFKALMGRGVVGSYDLAMKDPSELAAIIKRRLEPKNVHTIASPQGATKVLHMLWDRLGVVSEASDAATRVAVYEAAKAQGLSEAEATFRAIQIMDFSRRGASTSLALLTKLIPFLNARIQGLDVLYQAGMAGGRVLMGKTRGERDMNLGKKFLVRGAMLAAISLALEMLNDGDKDYEDLPDYLKKGNLLIPLKELGLEGQFVSIPKPFEAGLLFSTLPQMFYKTMAGESSTRQNISFFAESFASTFGVNPIPQILLPALEVMVNHDFYTGLPLISEGKARLSPELQYDSRTSTLSRVIGGIPIKYNFTTGQFEGISPIVLDKLIGGYAGPFGTLIASGVGMAMEGVDVGPERLPRNFTELPLIKRFFIDAESRNPKSVAEAYELFRIVDEANRSFSRLRQTGDVEAVMDYLETHKTVLSYKKYVYKLVDGLNKLSAYERQIERDKTMTDDQKLEAMKNLRDVRGRLTSQIGEINKALGR